MTGKTISKLTIFAVALILIGGCGSTRHVDIMSEPSAAQYGEIPPATSGAIYQANAGMHIFEDLKANRIGDILTVRLIEQTNASKSSGTSTSKSTEATLGDPTVMGRPVTRNGFPVIGGALSGDTSFDGAGSSNQSNSLAGNITVTVVDRYANGNLRIQGEKWVTLNQGKEFIRLSGVIRPYDIEPDNSVRSEKVANAQITYSSKGALAAANRMGIFARFFNSILSGF